MFFRKRIHMLKMSPFVLGFKVCIKSMPNFGSVPSILVQLFAVPMVNVAFYYCLAFYGFGTKASTASLGIGLAAFAATCSLQATESATVALSQDRFESTLAYIVTAVKNDIRLWLGRILALMLMGLVSGLVEFLFTWMLLGFTELSINQWLAIAALLLSSLIASSGVGICVMTISLTCKDAFFISNLCSYLLPLISGAVAPVDQLPCPIKWIAFIFPTSFLTTAGRNIATDDINLAYTMIIFSLIVGLMWLVGSLVVVRLCLTIQRKTDSIESLGI